jgi:hypothetical protein
VRCSASSMAPTCLYTVMSRSAWNWTICCWKPRPISPIVFDTGTRTSVNESSAVSLDHMPSFSSLRETTTPSDDVGTTMSDMPRYPVVLEVRASRQSQSAWVPFVM